MKHFPLRIIIGLLTFFVGVSIVMFCYLRPNSQPLTNKPILPEIQTVSEERENAWQTLLSFENQDLRKLSGEQEDKLQKARDILIGEQTESPRLISQISNSQEQRRFIFIQERPLTYIPGDSSLRVFLFDIEGKLLSSSFFPSGWRIGLGNIKVVYKSEIGREIIEVESAPAINGRDIAKQYYALIGEKILLIRLEDSRKQLVQNIYDFPNMTNGFTIINRSAEDWEKSLESEDTAEILTTLTWLNGKHLNSNSNLSFESAKEKESESLLIDELLSNKGVKENLQKLLHSNNKWIKSAAKLSDESK